LIAADAGEVRLDGLDPESDRRDYQRRLGFLPAGNGGLYARLTARRNLEFWSRIAFVPPGERQSAVDRAIERFELEELAEQRVDRMSMGQRQRVRLAMTFLHGPYVALLDEPHTSLDTEGLALLQAALESVCDAGGAAVWCSPAGLDGLGFDDAYTVVGGRLEPA
jgi:ABC-2 type transport system ATP-binding protein